MPSQDDTDPNDNGNGAKRALDRATSDFLSVIAHKIHTPITAINWQVEMLLDEKESGRLNDDQRAALKETLRSAMQLNDLSRALMYVFELEGDLPMMKPKDVPVCALIERAAESLRSLAADRGVRVDRACELGGDTVHVDPELAFMILRSLIENAILYSPAKSTVRITVQKAASRTPRGAGEDMGIAVCIEDRGCGIQNDLKRFVFTKFFRAPAARKLHTDGVGLGLFVAKSVARRTGGDITFESMEGKGSVFCWRIPSHREAKAPWER